MSLDRCIADREGGYDWTLPDADDHLDTDRQHDFEQYLNDVDIVVMGARCFEQGRLPLKSKEKDLGRASLLSGGGMLFGSC